MRLPLITLTVASLSIAMLACTAPGADDTDDGAAAASAGPGASVSNIAVVIGADSNGKIVSVPLGSAFAIRLADEGTAFRNWTLKSVDANLGQPSSSQLAGDSANQGFEQFTWTRTAATALVGAHTLILERSSASKNTPKTTFTVTVDLKPAEKPQTNAPTCGGFVHQACAGGTYCDFGAAGSGCGKGDVPGSCLATPTVCPESLSPVCACNGKTFVNGCEAHRAGFSISARGECSPQSDQ